VSSHIKDLSVTYAAFLNHAIDRKTWRFRNFMAFDRLWIDAPGSEDCHAHALWALGYCISHTNQTGLQLLAVELFEQALPVVTGFTSPRAWATVLIGIDEYLKRLGGDRRAREIRDQLVERLLHRFAEASGGEWLWFEDSLSYANARIPHALIVSGYGMNDAKTLETGLVSLHWLIGQQTSEALSFRPIGSNGFYDRGKERALFDQQPIEAQATVAACIAAFYATDDLYWATEARRAFEWFLGRNDLGLEIYDSVTGGCHDGLQIDRVSQNEGCESTLAFLLSLTEMQALQNTLSIIK
jgi:hypothetical protein